MKFKSLVKATLATASVVALTACGANSSNNGSSQQAETKKDIVTEVKSETTITFWHAMNGQQEKALQKLTEDFMKANPNIKVELQNQSQVSLPTFLSFVCGIPLRRLLGVRLVHRLRRKQRFC